MDQTISHLEGILAVRVFYDLVRDILLERGKPVLVKEFPSLLEKKGFRLPKRLVRYLLSLWDEGIIEDGFVDLSHRKEPSNRPLEGDIERLLRKAGKPISLGILSQELATVQRRVAEIYKQSLPSFISTRPKKYFLLNELVGLREWLLQVEEGATDDDVLFFNFHPEELSLLKQWIPFYEQFKDENPIEVVKILLLEKEFIPHKVLSYLVWKATGKVDSLALLRKMYEDGGFLLIKEMSWVSREQIPTFLGNLRGIEIPPGAVEPEPFIFGEEEQKLLLSYIEERERISVRKAAEELYELEDVDVEQVVATLSDFLKGQEGLLWLGSDRWTKVDRLPMEILAIPPEVEIDREFSYVDLDGEELEVELTDEGLENALPQLLKDPLIQDTGDEEPIEIEEPVEETQVLIPYHHYISGTLPVRSWELNFYPSEPKLQVLTFLTSNGEELELWFNRDLPLIFGLKQWYEKNLPPSGAILKIRKEKDVYRLIWENEIHPQLSVPQRRISDLLKLREELKDQPTVELIQAVLEYHKRAHFYTILSEVNIIRRTPKRRVASVLSIFPCFYLRSKEEEVFYYDAAKRDEVIKRAKKKYIIAR